MLKSAVSEVMLQQTQINTVCSISKSLPHDELIAQVIAYWKRWIERWPTIADLANADVEVSHSNSGKAHTDACAGSQCCLAYVRLCGLIHYD